MITFEFFPKPSCIIISSQTSDFKQRFIPFFKVFRSIDNQGISALGILGTFARDRDPLRISASDIVMFTSLVSHILTTIGVTHGLIGKEYEKRVNQTLYWTSIAYRLSEFAVKTQSIKRSDVKLAATAGLISAEIFPIYGLPLKGLGIPHMLSNAFSSIRGAYHNIRYRPFQSLCKAIILPANAAVSCLAFLAGLETAYSYLLSNSKSTQSQNPQPEGELESDGHSLTFDPHTWIKPQIDGELPDIETIRSMSDVERINYKKFQPDKVDHALAMISPEQWMAQLSNLGKSAYAKNFRDLSRTLHPDKSPSDAKCYLRLSQAKSTLDAWIKNDGLKSSVITKYLPM